MMFCNSFYFVLYFIGPTLVFAKSGFFTAMVDMQNLLYTEGQIVKTLEQYLELEEQRLEKVRRLSNEYNKLHKAASNDIEKFLSNPVNAYLLVKLLTVDWKVAENLINGSSGKEIIENNIHLSDLPFPDDEDLNGAASALMRLQDTYLLNASTLARGHIEGAAPSPELTSSDCFEIGRQAYKKEDFYYTVLWMQEALERFENENTKTSNKADILEYMAYSLFKLGNIRPAVKFTKDLLDINPDNPRAHFNLAYYTDAAAKSETQEKGNDNQITSELVPPLAEKPTKNNPVFARLCRGEKLRTPAEESKLKCRYFTNNHPFLLLQPVKEEELFLDPRIVLYHDYLSDKEIDEIKFLSTPGLYRAKVLDDIVNGEAVFKPASFRIGKIAWLDFSHEVVRRVYRRAEAITGLTTDTAEVLQIVNYGIGGYYEPHHDFAKKHERNMFKYGGNRIATFLTYLSDIHAGGATVFTTIGVQIKPIKGTAAFWYNLYKNGDGDFDTGHAACPVIAGSKWITSLGFHENGQEFRRPCSLDPDE